MKILYVTTIGGTMRFFQEHIKALLEEGHTVEVACNCKIRSVPDYCREMQLVVYDIPFSRSPLNKENIVAYKRLKRLIIANHYDIVHTHTPNASVCVRLACKRMRKYGLKVFYTAHGFHFYKGAPLKNWLFYYPVEKICSRWTDVLITINQEDYDIAKKKMHAKRVERIPGVGIDLRRFINCEIDRNAVRGEFGINPDEKVLIYVAELNQNKNQCSLLYMLSEVRRSRSDVKLMLVGKGNNEASLREQSKNLQIEDEVIFAGYRADVPELLRASDVAVPSSIREGLGLNVIEAMACHVPVVAYDNRGHRTIIRDGENGYIVPNGDYKAMAEKVNYVLDNENVIHEITEKAYSELQQYSSEQVADLMLRIYGIDKYATERKES